MWFSHYDQELTVEYNCVILDLFCVVQIAVQLTLEQLASLGC